MLKLDSLVVKYYFAPQMKRFYPKIELACVTQFIHSPIVENDYIFSNFCNYKLSPSSKILRAETGSLLMQVGSHIGSRNGRVILGVAPKLMTRMMKNHFYHEKQCGPLYVFKLKVLKLEENKRLENVI